MTFKEVNNTVRVYGRGDTLIGRIMYQPHLNQVSVRIEYEDMCLNLDALLELAAKVREYELKWVKTGI
jgi:hypothetical protein